MVRVEENDMSSITNDNAAFTTKKMLLEREPELIQLILERSDC